MKLGERFSNFLKGLKTKDDEEFEDDYIDDLEEEQKKEEEQKTIKQKMKAQKLFDALTEIKEQLDNKKLTPYKRLMLQLKLDLIETRLDKQLEQLRIKDVMKKIEEGKNKNYEIYNRKASIQNEEYNKMLDEKFDIEREVEMLSDDIEERKANYRQINTIVGSNEDADKMYTYTTKPEILDQLNEKQKLLDEIEKQIEAKKEEIISDRKDFANNQDAIDNEVSKQLRKYSPIALQFNQIRAFFKKATHSIKEWISSNKAEKDARNEAVRQAKENATDKVREQVAGIKKNENQRVVDKFKDRIPNEPLQEVPEEPKEDLKDENLKEYQENIEKELDTIVKEDKKEEDKEPQEENKEDKDNKEEKEKEDSKDVEEDTRTSEELTEELVARIQRGEDTADLTTKIVEKIKSEAEKQQGFRNSLRTDKTYEEQKEFVDKIQGKEDKEVKAPVEKTEDIVEPKVELSDDDLKEYQENLEKEFDNIVQKDQKEEVESESVPKPEPELKSEPDIKESIQFTEEQQQIADDISERYQPEIDRYEARISALEEQLTEAKSEGIAHDIRMIERNLTKYKMKLEEIKTTRDVKIATITMDSKNKNKLEKDDDDFEK